LGGAAAAGFELPLATGLESGFGGTAGFSTESVLAAGLSGGVAFFASLIAPIM